MSRDQVSQVPYLLIVFHACLCYAVLSVPCSLVVTCWKRADLLALLCVVFFFFFRVCLLPICVLIHIRTTVEVGTVPLYMFKALQ